MRQVGVTARRGCLLWHVRGLSIWCSEVSECLEAEMKLPGRAWLEFDVAERDASTSTIRQTAVFDPIGLAGLLYWYGIYPLHSVIFRGMLAEVARRARQEAAPRSAAQSQ